MLIFFPATIHIIQIIDIFNLYFGAVCGLSFLLERLNFVKQDEGVVDPREHFGTVALLDGVHLGEPDRILQAWQSKCPLLIVTGRKDQALVRQRQ